MNSHIETTPNIEIGSTIRQQRIVFGEWIVDLVLDADEHLGIFVAHESGSQIADTGEDLTTDKDFVVRLTCEAIETAYLKSLSDDEIRDREQAILTSLRLEHPVETQALKDILAVTINSTIRAELDRRLNLEEAK
jgi:hypothetical protein